MNLRKILGLCEHEWVLVKKCVVETDDEFTHRPVGHKLIYIYECEKCKKLKKNIIKL